MCNTANSDGSYKRQVPHIWLQENNRKPLSFPFYMSCSYLRAGKIITVLLPLASGSHP